MQINIIETYRTVVAICDSNLLGKKFEQGKFQLDVKESFYKGEEINQEKTIKLIQDFMKEDATFNIVGDKSIECAIRAGLISKKSVGKINGISHSLVLI